MLTHRTRGALACTTEANDAKNLTGFDVQAYIIEGSHFVVAISKDLG